LIWEIPKLQKPQQLMQFTIIPRYNLASMPNFAEAELLPKFTALTGMQPDCPIPQYLRSDAKLFFTNFAVFRRPAEQAPIGQVAPVVVATSPVDVATSAAPATVDLAAPAVAATQFEDVEGLTRDPAQITYVKVRRNLKPHN
jgi:hypothetical protein